MFDLFQMEMVVDVLLLCASLQGFFVSVVLKGFVFLAATSTNH